MLLIPWLNVGFVFTFAKFVSKPIIAYILPTAAPIILVGP